MNTEWKPIPVPLYDLILTGDLEALLWQLKGVREAEEVRMALYNARQTILSTSAPVDTLVERKQIARKAIEWATPGNVMAAPLVACEHIRGVASLVLSSPVGNILTAEPCPDCSPAPTSHPIPTGATGEDERKAFETWAVGFGYQRDELARCTIGIVSPEYFDLNTENVWKAWQARASISAPAAGDARDDLTLNQKYEDACILANANARDAGRYRVVRKSIVDEANGSNQVAAASEAIGLERGAYPTPDQFDAIVDHIAAQQGKVGEA